ncbi:unnamed protein product [marine sediment metagenome]|uniref:Uncharacterized protein n=1 Tax=marine sediment metagenome TaxID=412755 RepID=X1UND2_9ZZZZ
MPETRYIEEFKDGKLVKRIPYEVFDEELHEEADQARLKEISNMPPAALSVPVLAEGFKLLCKILAITEVAETEE